MALAIAGRKVPVNGQDWDPAAVRELARAGDIGHAGACREYQCGRNGPRRSVIRPNARLHAPQLRVKVPGANALPSARARPVRPPSRRRHRARP